MLDVRLLCIVCMGQSSGGVNENWNTRQWFPALVGWSERVKLLEELRTMQHSFHSFPFVVAALIELRHTSSQFAHGVHARLVPWMSVIQHVADTLHVPVFPAKND
ncbi:hypothetical protein K439DRAFT_1371078 [Ramaria rubella]|nr:hypothetical protein K439DRAFT_1371078 [Ramaria rubella]